MYGPSVVAADGGNTDLGWFGYRSTGGTTSRFVHEYTVASTAVSVVNAARGLAAAATTGAGDGV